MKNPEIAKTNNYVKEETLLGSIRLASTLPKASTSSKKAFARMKWGYFFCNK